MSTKDKKLGQQANLSPSAVGRLARALGITSKQLTVSGA